MLLSVPVQPYCYCSAGKHRGPVNDEMNGALHEPVLYGVYHPAQEKGGLHCCKSHLPAYILARRLVSCSDCAVGDDGAVGYNGVDGVDAVRGVDAPCDALFTVAKSSAFWFLSATVQYCMLYCLQYIPIRCPIRSA